MKKKADILVHHQIFTIFIRLKHKFLEVDHVPKK
jgi:hypothetical protein